MALNDKNLIITPNIGSANNPKIDFIGASESVGPSTITAVVSSTNNGTLSFEASAGQLVSITNNLTSGSIFSVNDVSGIPSIDVNANGNVSMVSLGSSLGIGTTNPTTKLDVNGSASFTDIRIHSVSEKSTRVSGNTVNLVYNTGGGNVAICTNPTAAITINVTGIPTDSTFDNRVISFTVITLQGSTGYACTTVNLNGVSRTTANGFLRYPGAVVSTASTSAIDIFNFTGINTVGSGTTTANYTVLAMVNGNFKSS